MLVMLADRSKLASAYKEEELEPFSGKFAEEGDNKLAGGKMSMREVVGDVSITCRGHSQARSDHRARHSSIQEHNSPSSKIRGAWLHTAEPRNSYEDMRLLRTQPGLTWLAVPVIVQFKMDAIIEQFSELRENLKKLGFNQPRPWREFFACFQPPNKWRKTEVEEVSRYK
jgi:hypothetical protein